MTGGADPAGARPLAGLLVVDLTRHLPGPLAARILCDLGARVVKVEEPSRGDPVRAAPPVRRGRGALANLLLPGVESVALDLGEAAARRVLARRLEDADVLLESFRPGTLERLGLPPERLRRRHPRLVICSLSGWGQDGPMAGRAGHDLTYQAVAGTLAPAAGMPGVQTADLLGAWSAVTAVLAALHRRHAGGGGCRIDAALTDAAVHGNLTAWAAEAAGPHGVGEALPLTGALPCYRLYRTRDERWLALAALERKFWHRLCDAVERPDLRRLQYRDEPDAHQRVAELIAGRTAAEWQEVCERHDLPGEVVRSAAGAAAHPQVRHRAVLRRDADGLPRLAFPARFDGHRPFAGGDFPALGAHTDEQLAELGMEEGGRWGRRRGEGIGARRGWRRWLWRLVSSWS